MEEQAIKKWIDLSLFVAMVISALLLSAILEVFWFQFGLPVNDFLGVQIYHGLGFLTSFLALVIVKKNDRIAAFLEEVGQEVSRVVWPGGRESALSTLVVLAMLGVAAVLFMVYNAVWSSVVGVFLA